MRNHDALGQARSATGVAEESSLLGTVSRVPFQCFQAVKLFALADEIIHCLEAIAARRLARHLENVYTILRDPTLLSSSARGVEQSVAGEESFCARVLQLVYELFSAVGRVRWRLDTTEAVCCPC
jgi:hypothetical protein